MSPGCPCALSGHFSYHGRLGRIGTVRDGQRRVHHAERRGVLVLQSIGHRSRRQDSRRMPLDGEVRRLRQRADPSRRHRHGDERADGNGEVLRESRWGALLADLRRVDVRVSVNRDPAATGPGAPWRQPRVKSTKGGIMVTRRSRMPVFRLQVFGCIAGVVLSSAPARAANGITEFPIPTPGRNPAEIVAGPDGNLWFTEGVADGGIGRITPSGEITEFPLPASPDVPGLGPITAGSDGAIWFRSKNFNEIDRITPDGQVTATKARVEPFEMTLGPDGQIWISECLSVGPALERQFPLPLPASSDPIDFCTIDGEPVGITTGADGNLWFAMDGWGHAGDASRGQIGKITLAGQITLFDAGGNNPEQIAAGPDGNLWFTDARHGAIGRSTPSGGITMYPIPSGS